jgi:hypothetical protein
MASAFNAKMMVGLFKPATCDAMPNGTKMSSTFSHDLAKMCRIENEMVPSSCPSFVFLESLHGWDWVGERCLRSSQSCVQRRNLLE